MDDARSDRSTRISCLSYDMTQNDPEQRYVVMKYFPTGDGAPITQSGHQTATVTDEDTLSRTYCSSDGSTRTIVVSAKRPVLPSGSIQNDSTVGQVTAIQNEVFVELDSSTGHQDVETDVQQILKRLRRDRLARIGAQIANNEYQTATSPDTDRRSRFSSNSSLQSWSTRDNLRTSYDSADSGIASSIPGDHLVSGSDTVTSQIVHPITKMAVLGDSMNVRKDGEEGQKRYIQKTDITDLERLLLKFEHGPIPKAVFRRPIAAYMEIIPQQQTSHGAGEERTGTHGDHPSHSNRQVMAQGRRGQGLIEIIHPTATEVLTGIDKIFY
ncbi:hypothetical protein LSH36_910g00044 [Paralvinella palmiformis]|uniref:Uncharacterized protein n=1 Tax=Paralvinella palmiformis TaxID=53620 RepID=A0AAD9MT28_9ANNE|nr:hypothetical protein LSH36_910g00044 [Paralvinella palmiformis]